MPATEMLLLSEILYIPGKFEFLQKVIEYGYTTKLSKVTQRNTEVVYVGEEY